jgi:hypothetical protein
MSQCVDHGLGCEFVTTAEAIEPGHSKWLKVRSAGGTAFGGRLKTALTGRDLIRCVKYCVSTVFSFAPSVANRLLFPPLRCRRYGEWMNELAA